MKNPHGLFIHNLEGYPTGSRDIVWLIQCQWSKPMKETRVYIFGDVFIVLMKGPFYQHGLTFIPEWINNHVPSKMCDQITYQFPTWTFND